MLKLKVKELQIEIEIPENSIKLVSSSPNQAEAHNLLYCLTELTHFM